MMAHKACHQDAMAIRSTQHSVSDRGEFALGLALNPWPINFFRRDYGIDGEVKLARIEPGEFNATVLPWSFEFQLKSKDWTGPLNMTITVRTRHLDYWLRHNVPTVVFSVITDETATRRAVYGRLIDKMFYQWLLYERTMWRDNETVSIPFSEGDLVHLIEGNLPARGSTDALASAVRSWQHPPLTPVEP